MTDLIAARAQMGTSLAFHIVFAALGIGLPMLLVISEGLYLKTGKIVYLALAKKWAKATAILFAVGAVSGTVLSFELGLLWPGFMKYAGSIVGMPFSLEGYAFFIEAIFLGLYLYGRDRLKPFAYWLTTLPVALGGMFSGIFIVAVNGWMNSPAGFKVVDGQVTDIDPLKAMFNAAWGVEGASLDPLGLYRDRVRGGGYLRLRHPAGPPDRVQPGRAGDNPGDGLPGAAVPVSERASQRRMGRQ